MTVVGYALEEALASLWRSGRSALVSIGTIAIAFITLGGFLLLSVNVQGMLDRWLEAAEISVYLQDTATDAERHALEQMLRARPEVAAVEYVSKERALQRFRSRLPGACRRDLVACAEPVPAGAGGAAAHRGGRRRGRRNPGPRSVRTCRCGRCAVRPPMAGAAARRGQQRSHRRRRRRGHPDAGRRVYGRGRRAPVPLRAARGARNHGAGRRAIQLHPRPIRSSRDCCSAAWAPQWPSWQFQLLYSVLGQWIGSDLAGLAGEGQLRFLGYGEIAIMLLGGVSVGAAAGTLASRAAHR